MKLTNTDAKVHKQIRIINVNFSTDGESVFKDSTNYYWVELLNLA